MGKQAVVIIHGIGEQKPMDTLRPFVQNIKTFLQESDKSEEDTIIRSKPDKTSENFETRRLSLSKSRKRPITDFYEFYWAHNMRDNKFSHIISWMYKLIFTRSSKVPKRLKMVWSIVWGLLIIFAAIIIIFFTVPIANTFLMSLLGIAGISTLISILALFAKNSFLNSAGDAGRYFSPTPDNIGERSAIRNQGLSFLRKLHEMKDGGYNRIIIVGHSLGSVIAYDLIRLLWVEYYKTHNNPLAINQRAIEELEDYLKSSLVIDVKVYQDLQFKCWQQQRAIGNEWLISDFITIGSPLCNADYLIPNNIPFEQLKAEREFPTCPPTNDEPGKLMHYYSKPYLVDGQQRTLKILHHAAPFAVTQWTNIFFTSDFVGGPVAPLFGKTIKDVEIPRKGLSLLPKGHTCYWDAASTESLKAICNALKLRQGKKIL